MKFQITNSEPIQFFNTDGEQVGTILIDSNGDMTLRPESGSSRDIILGDPNVAGDVQMGLASAPINLELLGGGTITSNGNTLNIGSIANGDTVIINSTSFSGSFSGSFEGDGSNITGVISSSYALTASHALNGGGGSAFPFVGDAVITGSLVVSGSGTQGDVIISSTASAQYLSTPSGNLSSISASYALTASHALNAGVIPTLQQVTDQGASTSNDITISGDLTASADISLPTNASYIKFNNAEIFGRSGGSYPGLHLASGQSSNSRIWLGDLAQTTGAVTMSFLGGNNLFDNINYLRAGGNRPLILQGGKGPNDPNDGVRIQTGDASNVYQTRFEIEADAANVDAYFTNINGLGINDTTPSATLDVNGNINTTSHITASGNVSSSAASTASFGTYLGDGSQLTGLPSPTFISSGSTSASAAPNTGVVVEHSGSTAFSVIGDVGTLFAIDDDLTGTLLSVNDISGIPQLEVSASGLVELSKGPLIANSFATGSTANGAPSSPLQMTIPSASSAQLFGVGGYFRASWDDGDSDHIWFEDDNIRLSYDLSGVDIEGTIMTDPASGEIHISLDKDGTRTALDKQVSDGIFDLNAVIGTDQTDRYIFAAPTDPTWPYYKIEVTRTSATHGSGFYAIVEKFI